MSKNREFSMLTFLPMAKPAYPVGHRGGKAPDYAPKGTPCDLSLGTFQFAAATRLRLTPVR